MAPSLSKHANLHYVKEIHWPVRRSSAGADLSKFIYWADKKADSDAEGSGFYVYKIIGNDELIYSEEEIFENPTFKSLESRTKNRFSYTRQQFSATKCPDLVTADGATVAQIENGSRWKNVIDDQKAAVDNMRQNLQLSENTDVGISNDFRVLLALLVHAAKEEWVAKTAHCGPDTLPGAPDLSKIVCMVREVERIFKRKGSWGITVPEAIWASALSFFPWHCEDLLLHAFNMLLWGSIKFWMFLVPGNKDEKDKLDTKLRKMREQDAELNNCPSYCATGNFHKDNCTPNILALLNEGFQIYVVEQKPGEIIVISPGVPHFGGQIDANLAYAMNVGSPHLWTKLVLLPRWYIQCPCDKRAMVKARAKGKKQKDLAYGFNDTTIYDECMFLHKAVTEKKSRMFISGRTDELMYEDMPRELLASHFLLGAPNSIAETLSNQFWDEGQYSVNDLRIRPEIPGVRLPDADKVAEIRKGIRRNNEHEKNVGWTLVGILENPNGFNKKQVEDAFSKNTMKIDIIDGVQRLAAGREEGFQELEVLVYEIVSLKDPPFFIDRLVSYFLSRTAKGTMTRTGYEVVDVFHRLHKAFPVDSSTDKNEAKKQEKALMTEAAAIFPYFQPLLVLPKHVPSGSRELAGRPTLQRWFRDAKFIGDYPEFVAEDLKWFYDNHKGRICTPQENAGSDVPGMWPMHVSPQTAMKLLPPTDRGFTYEERWKIGQSAIQKMRGKGMDKAWSFEQACDWMAVAEADGLVIPTRKRKTSEPEDETRVESNKKEVPPEDMSEDVNDKDAELKKEPGSVDKGQSNGDIELELALRKSEVKDSDSSSEDGSIEVPKKKVKGGPRLSKALQSAMKRLAKGFPDSPAAAYMQKPTKAALNQATLFAFTQALKTVSPPVAVPKPQQFPPNAQVVAVLEEIAGIEAVDNQYMAEVHRILLAHKTVIAALRLAAKSQAPQLYSEAAHGPCVKKPRFFCAMNPYWAVLTVPGDGHCVFNSVGLASTGRKQYHLHFRLLSIVGLDEFPKEFEKLLKVRDRDATLADSIRKTAVTTKSADSPAWGSGFHVVAIATACRQAIYWYTGFAGLTKAPSGCRKEMTNEQLQQAINTSPTPRGNFTSLPVAGQPVEVPHPLCILFDGISHMSAMLPRTRPFQAFPPATKYSDDRRTGSAKATVTDTIVISPTDGKNVTEQLNENEKDGASVLSSNPSSPASVEDVTMEKLEEEENVEFPDTEKVKKVLMEVKALPKDESYIANARTILARAKELRSRIAAALRCQPPLLFNEKVHGAEYMDTNAIFFASFFEYYAALLTGDDAHAMFRALSLALTGTSEFYLHIRLLCIGFFVDEEEEMVSRMNCNEDHKFRTLAELICSTAIWKDTDRTAVLGCALQLIAVATISQRSICCFQGFPEYCLPVGAHDKKTFDELVRSLNMHALPQPLLFRPLNKDLMPGPPPICVLSYFFLDNAQCMALLPRPGKYQMYVGNSGCEIFNKSRVPLLTVDAAAKSSYTTMMRQGLRRGQP